jgi:S-DNA-T family DNA segregation ATPase FtsK/SpoIIIE
MTGRRRPVRTHVAAGGEHEDNRREGNGGDVATVLFRRPPRASGPQEPRGELVLDPPPELPESVSGGGFGSALTMLPMLAGAASTVLLVAGPGARPITYIASGMFGLSMIAMMLGNLGRSSGEKRRRLDGDRRDYQRYLSQVRRRVRRAAAQQRAAALWRHVDPSMLWCVALSTRLWERRQTDADFAVVRVARGQQRLAVSLVTPETKPIEDLEPISAGALRRFMRTHTTVPDVPVSLALKAFGRVRYTGDTGNTDAARANARAIVAQAATWHSPDDLIVVVCAGPGQIGEWEWAKWLPHALSPTLVDAVGQARFIARDALTLEAMLGDVLSRRARFGVPSAGEHQPHVLVVLDGGLVQAESQLASGLIDGVTVLDLHSGLGSGGAEQGPGHLHLRIASGQMSIVTVDNLGQETLSPLGRADALTETEAQVLARRLAPYRISLGGGTAPEDALAGDMDLPQLLRLGDPYQVDPAVTWRPRAARDRLRVPIGVGGDGHTVELDIKESAQGGMGPHGLVIGATGSGKSELLRTLVLGLALTHSSETLNFVLVDFKGGATFASLDALPHTSAVITNLSDNLLLVDRMRDALAGEMNRRQEALRDAGNFASLRDYERAREQGAPLEPMPSLFVVVDEFSELLTSKPDFIELFVQIGRLGRSLGVHLLLASQRLEEGKLRGLDTHLSYRVGLRTFSALESRVVLGVPDAYELPSAPGHGYLKMDTTGMTRFKAAYVSGPVSQRTRSSASSAASGADARILPYSASWLAPRSEPAPAAAPDPDSSHDPAADPSQPVDTLMDVLVARLEGAGVPARQVWLPPLEDPPSLDALLPALAETPDGLRPADWGRVPPLTVPVGIVDRPFEQRRDPHWLELASSHMVIVGGPQTGKSTALRSVLSSLVLTHSPRQVQVYALDFGGGTLAGLADLPHVGMVASRLEPDRIRRTVAEVRTMLDERERLFAQYRIDSIATYRRMVAGGQAPLDAFGDVFLVVDGWGVIRSDHEEIEAQITAIAARGLGFGVHVILTAARWMDIRPALKDLIATRLELRLGDPTESDIDRRAAVNVPERTPGRGLSADKMHLLMALPRIDGASTTDDLADGVADMVKRVNAAWSGPRAPEVRLLPLSYPFASLPAPPPDRAAVPFGIDEGTLSPVWLDFDAEPHFVAFGDVESGKSNLLRVIAHGITTRWTPKEAKVITFDYRRGLLGAIQGGHQIGYVMNSTAAPEMAGNIAAALRERVGSITIDPSSPQVSTWGGPKLFLLIDDYEMLASAAGNPLAQIVEFIPQARDIGLHIVLARSAGGAGRASFDPLLQRMREMGTPGVLLSGAKDEGAILGSTRMEPFPPGRGRFVHRRTGANLVQTAKL